MQHGMRHGVQHSTRRSMRLGERERWGGGREEGERARARRRRRQRRRGEGERGGGQWRCVAARSPMKPLSMMTPLLMMKPSMMNPYKITHGRAHTNTSAQRHRHRGTSRHGHGRDHEHEHTNTGTSPRDETLLSCGTDRRRAAQLRRPVQAATSGMETRAQNGEGGRGVGSPGCSGRRARLHANLMWMRKRK